MKTSEFYQQRSSELKEQFKEASSKVEVQEAALATWGAEKATKRFEGEIQSIAKMLKDLGQEVENLLSEENASPEEIADRAAYKVVSGVSSIAISSLGLKRLAEACQEAQEKAE